MATKANICELIGKDLSDFRVVEMTEVYRVDTDGHKSSSLGFFKSSAIAEAFAGVQKDTAWYKTVQALVLTNGTLGYVIAQQEPVRLFDDESEAREIKKKVAAKLSPAERKLLGLE